MGGSTRCNSTFWQKLVSGTWKKSNPIAKSQFEEIKPRDFGLSIQSISDPKSIGFSIETPGFDLFDCTFSIGLIGGREINRFSIDSTWGFLIDFQSIWGPKNNRFSIEKSIEIGVRNQSKFVSQTNRNSCHKLIEIRVTN